MAAPQFRNYEEDKAEAQRFLREFYKSESDGKKHFTYLEQLVCCDKLFNVLRLNLLTGAKIL